MTDQTKMPSNVGALEGHQVKQIQTRPILALAQKMGNEKPNYLAPDFSMIEKSFADHKNFVLWKAVYSARSRKWTKVPKKQNGKNASSTDISTHIDLQAAKEAFQAYPDKFDGIGIVFIEGDNTCGIDLDKVISDDGEIEPWADEIRNRFKGTYIEKSVSGNGYHIICKGVVPHCGKGGLENRLEMYDKERYFTLTGHLAGEVATVTDQQENIDWLYATHFKDKHELASDVKIIDPVAAGASCSSSIGNDDEILQRCNARAEFVKLFRGDWQGDTYPSQSEAEQALCNKLSYYTIEHDQIDRLFRKSGLMRDKWDRSDYRQETINKAINGDAAKMGIEARTVLLPLSLDIPIDEPHKIFHPNQMKWKEDKTTGEMIFSNACGTTENLGRLANAYGLKVRYNEMSKSVEITMHGLAIEGDLAASKGLSILSDLATINNYPRSHVAENIEGLAHSDTYHPAVDWIRSRAWDKVSRIDALFATLILADPTKEKTSYILFRKWLIGAASIITGKINKFEHVLVLVDTKGGIGKTRWFDKLCPSEFRSGGVSLDVNNKDSVIMVVSKSFVELGEIDSTFKKSAIEALKAFLSKSEDELRRPYGKTFNKYQRRTAFLGTVNDIKFLQDSTNNRRFWPVEVSNVNYQHRIDMQQVWAECEYLAEQGEIHYLTPAENQMIAIHNETFKAIDPIEELIKSEYSFDDSERSRRLTCTDIAKEIGYQHPTRSQLSIIGKVLQNMKIKCTPSKGLSRYHMPLHKTDVFFSSYRQIEGDYSDLI